MFDGMLVVACLAFELALGDIGQRHTCWMAGLALVLVFMLVWAELAIGVLR